MALSPLIEWDVQTGGNSANGGGFKSGASGTDYSQQTSAQKSNTDLAIHASDNTKVQPVAAGVAAADIGNIVNITAGSGFTTGRYEITAQDGTYWTLDRAAGTTGSTGGTYKMGGCLDVPPTVLNNGAAVAGNTVWVKSGTYTLTATWTIGAGTKGDITNGRIKVHGYSSTHGDYAGRPVITSATNSVALLTLNDADYYEFRHLKFTHTAATRGNGINPVTSNCTPFSVIDCIFDGCLYAHSGSTGEQASYVLCEMTNCTGTARGAIGVASATSHLFWVYGCDIHDNSSAGVTWGNSCSAYIYWSIIDTNTQGGLDTRINTTQDQVEVVACTIVDNGSHGLIVGNGTSGTYDAVICNNIFYNNTGYGIQQNSDQAEFDATARLVRNNAFGANSSGAYTGLTTTGDITLTADPFTNRGSRDFSLNNTAGGGAACRAAAFPAAVGITNVNTNYRDVGPLQHQDAGSGGVIVPNQVIGAEGLYIGA